MSIPTGANRVTFSMTGMEGETEGPFLNIVADNISGADIAELDAAMEAAGNAALASLEASFPLKTFTAGRTYTCNQPGDPWPV